MAVLEGLTGYAMVSDPDGVFRLEEVVTAPVGPDDIGVQVAWSGVSIGTEFAVLTGKLDWGNFPIVTGYMASGNVVAVGERVSGIAVGDSVYMRNNRSLTRRSDGKDLNCRAGLHASVAVLDPRGSHGAALVPPGVALDEASLFVMPAVGLYGVDMADVNVGATVVVIGLGMIGLGVVSAAARRGARVVGIDPRPECRTLAQVFGAVEVLSTSDPRTADVIDAVTELCGGEGADFVFESTGRPESLDAGIKMCKRFGCFVWQGNYGNGQISFEFLAAHGRRLRMVFPCDDGYRDYRDASLRAIASGAMPWGRVITHRIGYKEMPNFYSRIYHGEGGSVIGSVIDWNAAA